MMADDEQVEIYFQLDEDVSGVVTPQADTEGFSKLSAEQIEQVISTASSVAACVATVMKTIGPAGAEVEFGIQAGGEAGVPFVAKGTIGAHFKITLKWGSA